MRLRIVLTKTGITYSPGFKLSIMQFLFAKKDQLITSAYLATFLSKRKKNSRFNESFALDSKISRAVGCFVISLILQRVSLNRVKTLVLSCLCTKNIFTGLVNCCFEFSNTPAIQKWVDRRV